MAAEELKRSLGLSEDEFVSVKPYVVKAVDLGNLKDETDLDIRLELLPAVTIDDDEFDDHNFPDTAILDLVIRGHKTKAKIELSTGRSFEDGYLDAAITARNTMIRWVAQACPHVVSLFFNGSMYQVQYTVREYVQFVDASDFYDDFAAWTNVAALFKPFSDVGHWKNRLRQLEIDGCEAEFGNTQSNLQDSFQSWPEQLESLSLTCIQDKEDDVNQLIKAFPTVKTVEIRCPEKDICDHYETVDYTLKHMIKGLHETNKSLRSLAISGRDDDGTVRVSDNDHDEIFQVLTHLPCLERLSLRSAELNDSFAEELVTVLPKTTIQDVCLKGMNMTAKCFGHLHSYLLQQDSCKLHSFDLNVACLDEGHVTTLFQTLAKQTVPSLKLANQRRTTLDFLLLMRRFRHLLAMETSQAAPIWPWILSRADSRRKDQWLNASSEWRGYRTPSRLNRSLLFALLRQRVDIVSDSLQAKRNDPGGTAEPTRKRCKAS